MIEGQRLLPKYTSRGETKRVLFCGGGNELKAADPNLHNEHTPGALFRPVHCENDT